MRILVLVALLIAISACQRETRNSRPEPVRLAVFGDAARESELQPGGAQSQPVVENPFHNNASAISEGQRLYDWYNCSGCHFKGGGGIGPPLLKKDWIYGGEPANLFDTIVKGRPNGMPSWGGKIPEYQVWQLVAYLRALNNQESSAATPVRGDTIEPNSNTVRDKAMAVPR